MRQKRMTSLEVIDTDAFLDMPQSCQLLYFHLNARADDDGFIASPKKIMKSIGSQDDDIKLLIAKKFLIAFDDGVVVVKHWRINNFIRKDLYEETRYLNHKQTLFIRPNGAYTLTDNGEAIPLPRGHFAIDDIKNKIENNLLLEPQNHVNVDVTTSLTQKKRKEYKIKENNINIYPFSDFWSLYPKKVGKRKSEELWGKLSLEEKKLILEDIPLRKRDDKWVNGFIKDPERYIKNKQWEDEIILPRGKKSSPLQAEPNKYANL